jgi:hypothetical protein
MKSTFLKDRKAEIERFNQQQKPEILTEEKLAGLPDILRKHFALRGFIGKPIMMNADIIWKESFIKLRTTDAWKPLKTLQFNSVNPIMRTAHMKVSKMFFAGKDLYRHGKGSMIGKILNLFTVMNVKGPELSQSALITSFAESMLISGYALQDYMSWEEISPLTLKATLRDHDFVVEGLFHFEEDGRFRFFESDDRYFDEGGGNFVKKKFKATFDSYRQAGDFIQPENIRVMWCLDEGDFVYYKGTIERIDSNVAE